MTTDVLVIALVAVVVIGTLAALRLSRTLNRETHGWQREREQQRGKEAQPR